MVYGTRSGKGLPSGVYFTKEPTVHRFYHSMGSLRVGAYTLRPNERTCKFPKVHGTLSWRIKRRNSHPILWTMSLCSVNRLSRGGWQLTLTSPGFYDRPGKGICQSLENHSEHAQNANATSEAQFVSPPFLFMISFRFDNFFYSLYSTF